MIRGENALKTTPESSAAARPISNIKLSISLNSPKNSIVETAKNMRTSRHINL